MFVWGFGLNASMEDVVDHLNRDAIYELRLIMDGRTMYSTSLGYAFLIYKKPDDAKLAVETVNLFILIALY